MAANFSATFVPGRDDDYFMPEVVAPSPQRVNPQVPQNMQEGLQRMELEARNDSDRSGNAHKREPSLSTYVGQTSSNANFYDTDADITAYQQDKAAGRTERLEKMSWDAPSFSPFPKVKGDNIPPTDDEKEEILWNARKHVLHSQNVPMQIIWARDVLMWADVAGEASTREANVTNKPRPASPKVEHELRIDAINIIEYLAGQEHPEALYLRSKWLEFGKFGNRVDKKEAFGGYRRASDLGNVRSEYRMGMLFEQSNDMSKAKEHYYKGLAQKDSAAMYRMGMMSLLGQHGETKDYPRGLERIQAAADSADEDAPQGAYVYGMLVGRDLPDIDLPEGLVVHNVETAKMYVEKAAYLGFSKAQLKMGQAYELCQIGCDFNPAYSLHYYGLAAKQGLPEAALGVSRWFLFGYEGVFRKNEELAFKYAQEASAAKLSTGAFALGYYYEIGIHVQKSIPEAQRWYGIAAEQGNKDAIGRLDSLNHDKSLSKKDHETTTLTRIKSQHGSQRGQRPERFRVSQQMPTVSESPSTPVPGPQVPLKAGGRSPPTMRPAPDHADFPDPSRPSYDSSRVPAFNIRLDATSQPPARPHSAVPYPDDRPAALNFNRPKSTAPYPDDDVRPPVPSQKMNPVGPQADRPGSAFGIAPQGGRPMPASQSLGSLQPQPHPAGQSRVSSWGGPLPPQHSQPGPGQGSRPYPDQRLSQTPQQQSQRPVSAAPYASGALGPSNRLQKPLPGGYPSPSPVSPAGDFPPKKGYNQPPRQDRMSNVPPSQDPRYASAPHGRAPPAMGGDPRHSSTPPMPAGGRTGSAPPSQGMQKPQVRPGGLPHSSTYSDGRTGYDNRLPHGDGRAGGGPESRQSSAPSAAPAAKPQKGPATFEDMGIPQGKQDSDCVVM